MLSSKDLQYYYTKFYIEMRRYIWDITTVEMLVNFEIPDIQELKTTWSKLKFAINSTLREDKQFRLKAEKIDNLLDTEDVYCEIYKIREVPTA